MNAHRSRSMFSRRHLIPLSAFLLFSLVVICGLMVGAARSAAKEWGVASNTQRPPGVPGPFGEDIEKEFNDDDLKEKGEKPRGKWGFGLTADMGQFNDSSVPVVISGIQSLSGGGSTEG